MDLSDLRIFTTVVREGGVTRAAEKLNRVQSNVTTRIRQLEEDLDVDAVHPRGQAAAPGAGRAGAARLCRPAAGARRRGPRVGPRSQTARPVSSRRDGEHRRGAAAEGAERISPSLSRSDARASHRQSRAARDRHSRRRARRGARGRADRGRAVRQGLRVRGRAGDRIRAGHQRSARKADTSRRPSSRSSMAVPSQAAGGLLRQSAARCPSGPSSSVPITPCLAALPPAWVSRCCRESVLSTFPESKRLTVHRLPPGENRAETVLIWRKGAGSPTSGRCRASCQSAAVAGLEPRQ